MENPVTLVRFPLRARSFSLLQNFQTGSGYRGRIIRGVKRRGHEPEHSSSSVVEVQNIEAILHTPLSFHGVHWDFTSSLSYCLVSIRYRFRNEWLIVGT